MIISELNAFANLLGKAGTFADYVRDSWYKSSTELRTFRVKVKILSQKHEERSVLLRKFGQSDDLNLSDFVEEAENILNTEQERARRLEKSRWERLKGRVFSGRLTEILGSMEQIVDANLQLLKARVDMNGVLERNLNYTAIPLPFKRDLTYVPIAHSIVEVQTAVESVEGSRVVVVHGDGGLGKSSLVKYVALHYDEVNRKRPQAGGSASELFPDGVFYMQCGKGGSTRIKELEQELLERLGFGSEARADGEREGGYQTEPSPSRFHRSLRFKLSKRKSLIILDDVHESEVLERLLISGDAVTYLITSRRRDIWPGRDVRRILIEKPSLQDATKILGMYTKLAEDVEEVLHSIIEDVDFHPLMLANIGLAMGSTRENGPDEWRKMAKGWQDKLEKSGFKHHPVIYRQLYQFYMEESMNLMMDSLEEGEQSLLRLMSLLENERLPEVVVKFFRKSMEPEEADLEYRSYVNQLHDKSLLEVYSPHVQGSGRYVAGVENRQTYLAIHKLRAIYIRKNSSEQLKSMAFRALEPATSYINNYSADSSMARGVLHAAITTTMGALRSWGWGISRITGRGDWTQRNNPQPAVLTAIMAAMFVDKAFWDAVEPNASSVLRAPCRDVSIVPGSVNAALDVMDLVKRARDKKHCTRRLVGLLNPDGEGWKQEAHHYAAKIIVRFVCREELDDISVAQLVKLQNTTVIICDFLRDILRDGYWASEYVERKITFSSAHSMTIKSFLDHLHDDTSTIPIKVFYKLIGTLTGWWDRKGVLDYENEDTIFNIGEVLIKMLREDTNKDRQDAFILRVFRYLTRTAIVMGKMPDLGKGVLSLLVDEETSNRTGEIDWPIKLMLVMSQITSIAPQILDVPGAVDMLWALTVPPNIDAVDAARILINLTKVLRLNGELDNIKRVLSNRKDLVNLLNSVSSLEIVLNLSQGDKSQICGDEFLAVMALVELLGNLGVTKEVREKILHFCPEVLERLQALESLLLKHAAPYVGDTLEEESLIHICLAVVSTTKTIFKSTLLNSAIADDNYDLPISTKTFQFILVGKFSGLLATEMYKEALDIAPDIDFDYFVALTGLREGILFAKAMVEDYSGALTIVNDTIFECQQRGPINLESARAYAHRGILKRLSGGNLAEAVADFDVSLNTLRSNFLKKLDVQYLLHIYYFLKQRGFAKYLSGDNTGARTDAQTAQDLELRNLVWDPMDYTSCHFRLLQLRTDYLGFVFSL